MERARRVVACTTERIGKRRGGANNVMTGATKEDDILIKRVYTRLTKNHTRSIRTAVAYSALSNGARVCRVYSGPIRAYLKKIVAAAGYNFYDGDKV